ncbi:hypothetical protein [Massilia sp. HP4]|uniref:hypothetical protein n=1 Tax=Massilia sp. HP4 TaxID=2562316 RepID=UPI0010C11E54|nr:hypothetical protein [Massilia sp. HP4]
MHVKRSMPATALATLLALGGLAGAVKAVEAKVNVHHRLEVETGATSVKVRVLIENRGDQSVWIPREIALGDDLTAPRFNLRTPEEEVAYTGRMVKRAAPGLADYLEVKPQTTHLNTIDITQSYAFKPGQHSYEIRYAGPWLANPGKLDAASIKSSPAIPVKFSFTQR